MFHIVTLFLFSSIMFSAVYQFWFNKNDMMMMVMKNAARKCLLIHILNVLLHCLNSKTPETWLNINLIMTYSIIIVLLILTQLQQVRHY